MEQRWKRRSRKSEIVGDRGITAAAAPAASGHDLGVRGQQPPNAGRRVTAEKTKDDRWRQEEEIQDYDWQKNSRCRCGCFRGLDIDPDAQARQPADLGRVTAEQTKSDAEEMEWD
jgi:hypothetical protein